MKNWLLLLSLLSVSILYGNPSLPAEGKAQSITYALPYTKLGVHMEVSKTKYIPGPFAEYCRELIGVKNYISKKGEKWKITNARLEIIKEIDPKHIYNLNAGEKQSIDLKKLLELTSGQIIFPIQGTSAQVQREMIFNHEDESFIYIPYEDVDKERIDTVYKKEFRDSMKVDVPYYIRKYNPKNKRDFAEEAAELLLYIRERKIALLTMEEEAYEHSQASIEALNNLEREYLELFVGKKTIEKLNWVEYVIPNTERINVAKFSPSRGFSGAQEGGQILALSVLRNAKINSIKGSKADGTAPIKGIKVRIPESVLVEVKLGDELLVRQSLSMEQFGTVVEISGSNFMY